MTVAELIEKLKGFDPNLPVWVECPDCYYSGALSIDDVGAADIVGNVLYATGDPIEPDLNAASDERVQHLVIRTPDGPA